MSVRQTISDNKSVATVAAVLLVLVAGWIIFRQLTPDTPGAVTQAYYSADDGKTYFVASSDKVVPFDHEGNKAVKAFVYTCPDGSKFVGFLERYTERVRPVVEKARADRNSLTSDERIMLMQASATGVEFKKPGDSRWTPGATRPSARCPDGSVAQYVQP